jgi:hypothetical protein
MALEDQSTSNEHFEREIAELRRKLPEGKRSRLVGLFLGIKHPDDCYCR